MTQFYAVTSVDGSAGSWQIVADGTDPGGVMDRAIYDLTGGQSYTVSNLPLSLLPMMERVKRLKVLTRRQARSLVGARGFVAYSRVGGHGGVTGLGGDGGAGGSPGGGGDSSGGGGRLPFQPP